MGNFTFSLASVGSSATSFETSLNSKTKDEDLTYTGTDTIVWDRVNGERLRRGLPGLASLGYPRPPEETPAPAAASTAGGGASTFEIKGPPGMTYEQAKAIFDKQVKTGALVGFKSGDTLSAATQAADGLASAQSQLAQGLTGVPGLASVSGLNAGSFASALSASGVDLKTGRIASVDAAFAKGGLSAAGGVLGTSINSAAFNLGGAGGALNGSLSGLSAGLSGVVGPAVSSVNGVLTGAAGQLGSVATQSISTINKAITGTAVTSPIDVANFVKQTPALTSIGNMAQSEVTAVLAQAKNLVGQGASVLSNTKGVGEFGLNISQLETAGILKPGTAALAAAGSASISSMLKSPAVYTGKDGIKNVKSLLSNVPKQTEIQQQLMSKGLNDLKAVGIPVDKLSAQGVAGVALSAAKSVPNTENLLKNLPVPADAKAAFDTAVRDGAFAVNLADTKVPDVYKAVDVPVPATDTVNRATVDAATTRVLGNDKIPAPNYNPHTVENIDARDAELNQGFANIADYGDSLKARQAALSQKISVLENQQTITQAQWDAVNSEREKIRDDYNNIGLPTIVGPVTELYNSSLPAVQRAFRDKLLLTQKFLQQILAQGPVLNERIKALKPKIEGVNT
jgi:hypothetical protein